MTQRTVESSIQELETIKNETKQIQDFLKGKELSAEQYTGAYETVKKQFDTIKKKINDIYIFLQSEKDNISSNQEKAIGSLIKAFSELKIGFEGLIKPEDFRKKFDQKKPTIVDINNGPKSALFDIPLTQNDISKISPEKFIAKNGSIEYYTVNVPKLGKRVLRINRSDSGDEVALLEVSNQNLSDSEICEEINNAEISTAGNTFKDIEVDGYNAWNTNGGSLAEGFEQIQDTAMGAVTGGLTYAGLAKAVGTAATLKIAATGAAGTTAATGAYIAPSLLVPGTAAAGIGAKLLGFGKIVVAGVAATGTALASTPGIVIIGTGVAVGAATTAFTDGDLTTARAEKFGLTKKLDNVKNIKINYIS